MLPKPRPAPVPVVPEPRQVQQQQPRQAPVQPRLTLQPQQNPQQPMQPQKPVTVDNRWVRTKIVASRPKPTVFPKRRFA
jgi:cell division protein ZipA